MFKHILSGLILLGLVVVPRGTPFGAYTTSPLNLYVATTGNDSNPCLNATAPCATIQGAVDKVPKAIRHPVTVTLASGTYANGAYVEGFSCPYTSSLSGASPTSTQSPWLQINGTQIAATLSQGLQTGTVASATAGGAEYLVSSVDLKACSVGNTCVRGILDADLGTSINRTNAVQGGDLTSAMWTGATTVQCRMTSSSGNLSTLSAGSTTFYLTIEPL
jgi:hypothetical protein